MKWLGHILLYVGLPLVLAEVTEVAPWLAARLLRSAARMLPREHQDRYELEWLGELGATPGKVLKLLFAARISLRVPATKRELNRMEPIWVMLARRLLAAVITAALAVAGLASRLQVQFLTSPQKRRQLVIARSELVAHGVAGPHWVRNPNGLALETPIEELDLFKGTYNSLKRARIARIEDLVRLSEPDRQLLKIRNFGRASLEELQEKLSTAGWDHESWD